MLGFISLTASPLLAQSPVGLSPILTLILCALAGIGTVLLLPGRREAAFRKIGGAIILIAALILFAALPGVIGAGVGRIGSVYFWTFSAIALFSALRVVTHPRPVYSALYFVLTVFASAGLFVLLEAEFMAAALILIYAGAILVTYVFVIMLASQATTETATTPARQMAEYDSVSREPLAAAAIGFALMGILLFVIFDRAGDLAPPAGTAAAAADAVQVTGNTQELGMFLFRNQLVQLELAGLILTLAMIGAIIIARRQVLVSDIQHPPGTSKPEVVVGPATPVDDNPHSIPVYGTDNPRQKAYPQT